MVQKIYWKMYHVLCTNAHHDVKDFVKHRMVKNTKTWISWERDIIVWSNKKKFNLCLRWHFLRNYCFVAEVTFNFDLIINGSRLFIINFFACHYHISKRFGACWGTSACDRMALLKGSVKETKESWCEAICLRTFSSNPKDSRNPLIAETLVDE